MKLLRYLLALVLAAALFGCDSGSSDETPVFFPPVVQVPPRAVYTMNNSPGGNQILVFGRMADGSLSVFGQFATGGTGSGDGLNGSTNALEFQAATNRFFAVNAGDNTVSMMQLAADGSLSVLDRVNTGGVRPISVTVSNDLVYVLNFGDAGTPANIVGFRVNGNSLQAIANSTRGLSAPLPNPAQIEFNPAGNVLVVTERDTNFISTFTVNTATGLTAGPNFNGSAGATPFGFDFTPGGALVVSEAQQAVVDGSTVSSYTVDAGTGNLNQVSASVPDTETGACWVEVTPNGAFAYVTNTGSDSVSGYSVSNNGALALLDPGGVTGATGDGPVDEAITPEGDFLYVLNRTDGTLSIFAINGNGSLTPQPTFAGLPATPVGLVAR
ncbi:MAG: lactonase family protein [Vulcanimicrobiota bacterium]